MSSERATPGNSERTRELHMTPSPGIEPGLHWWEANAQPLRHPCSTTTDYSLTSKTSQKNESVQKHIVYMIHRHFDRVNFGLV